MVRGGDAEWILRTGESMAALVSRQRVLLSRDVHAGALEDLGFRFGRGQLHASCS